MSKGTDNKKRIRQILAIEEALGDKLVILTHHYQRKAMGLTLIELDDWNCCGSSSAHSLFTDIALHLASRNLSLATSGRSLLVACPSCNLRLRYAHLHLQNDQSARIQYKAIWGRYFDPHLKIIHFFELFSGGKLLKYSTGRRGALKGLKFVPYYGCMLTRPPALRREKNNYGLMEEVLSSVSRSYFQSPWVQPGTRTGFQGTLWTPCRF